MNYKSPTEISKEVSLAQLLSNVQIIDVSLYTVTLLFVLFDVRINKNSINSKEQLCQKRFRKGSYTHFYHFDIKMCHNVLIALHNLFVHNYLGVPCISFSFLEILNE